MKLMTTILAVGMLAGSARAQNAAPNTKDSQAIAPKKAAPVTVAAKPAPAKSVAVATKPNVAPAKPAPAKAPVVAAKPATSQPKPAVAVAKPAASAPAKTNVTAKPVVAANPVVAAKPAVAAKAVVAAKPVAAPAKAPAVKVTAQAAPVAKKPAPSKAVVVSKPVVAVKAAPVAKSPAPAKKEQEKTAESQAKPEQAASADKPEEPVKNEKAKVYSANGRRDPFISPVVNTSAVGSGCSTGKRCLSVGQISLKGVVKSETGMIAVVVNALDKAYFLRENDPVFDGYVLKITTDSIVFKETVQDKLGKPFTREVTKKIMTPVV